jgi:hypothetical protein
MSLEGLSEDELRAILQRAGVEPPPDAPRKALVAQIKKRGLQPQQPSQEQQPAAKAEACSRAPKPTLQDAEDICRELYGLGLSENGNPPPQVDPRMDRYQELKAKLAAFPPEIMEQLGVHQQLKGAGDAAHLKPAVAAPAAAAALDPTELLQRANAARTAQKWDQAKRTFTALLKLSPDHAEAKQALRALQELEEKEDGDQSLLHNEVSNPKAARLRQAHCNAGEEIFPGKFGALADALLLGFIDDLVTFRDEEDFWRKICAVRVASSRTPALTLVTLGATRRKIWPENLGSGRRRDHAAVLRMLLSSGRVRVEARDSAGWTALHHAVMDDQLELAKMLLEAGADPNVYSRLGDMPLHKCIMYRKSALARLLSEYGADWTMKPPVKGSVSPLEILRGWAEGAAIMTEFSKLKPTATPHQSSKLGGVASSGAAAATKDADERCDVCQGPSSVRCGSCWTRLYCGAACQKADWQAHKPTCAVRKPHVIRPEQLEEKWLAIAGVRSLGDPSSGKQALVPPQCKDAASTHRIVVKVQSAPGLPHAVYTKDKQVLFGIPPDHACHAPLREVIHTRALVIPGPTGPLGKGYFNAVVLPRNGGLQILTEEMLPLQTW